MSQLVDELKRDHVQIVALFEQLKTLGVAGKEGQAKLLSSKQLLLAHLKKEDERLYPALREAAAKNEAVKRLLDTFAKDMTEISGAVLQFFDKYAQGGSGFEFSKDYGKVVGTLGVRVQREENILYKEYDKLGI